MVLTAFLAAGFVTGCGGTDLEDRSSQVAEAVHASSCFATDYYLEDRQTGDRMLIYNCDRAGKVLCVTEENGIASDSTEAVRFVFADSLSGKPDCV